MAALVGCADLTISVDADTTVAELRDFDTIKEDARIKLEISGAFLDDKSGAFKNVNLDVYESAVLLTGAVATGTDKLRAVEIVRAVNGVSNVFDELQVAADRDFQQAAQDVAIETQIKIELLDQESINSVNMRWRSVNGTVYLFGRALSEQEQAEAIALIAKIKGVQRVINQQFVRAAPGVTTF